MINGTTAQQTVGLFFNEPFAQDGYTLWTPNRNTYLIDNCGRLINSWEHDYLPGLSAYLLEDGSLLRAGRQTGVMNAAGVGGRIEKFSWDGEVLWSYAYISDNWHQHHDIEPLPNGNVLILAWERKTDGEAVQAGSESPREYWVLHIVELEPQGLNDANIVWEWHMWDHLIQDHDPQKDNYGVIADHPELVNINFNPPAGNFGGFDWLHTNGIDYNPLRDEILFSARDLNEVIVIYHSTSTEEAAGHTGGQSGRGGDILYRWGNPQSYQRKGPEAQQLFLQHDARWIPQGYPRAGQIMVFNNGISRPGGSYSTVDIIEPPLDSDGRYLLQDGESYGPNELAWTYPSEPNEEFFSSIMSGAHPLPNGNFLISVSDINLFIEVTEEGDEVWRYINPVGISGPVNQGNFPPFNNIFRATRYPSQYPAFDGRDLIPGEPLELNPTPSDCQRFPVSTINLSDNFDQITVQVAENPFSEALTLHKDSPDPLALEIYQLDGRRWHRSQWENPTFSLSTDHWPPGLYLASVRNLENGQISGIKIVKQ